MLQIINELNKENSTNYKLKVLEKYRENELFKTVLQMTYDKTKFTYGITMKNIKIPPDIHESNISLESVLKILREEFCTRKVTGNQAIYRLTELLKQLSKDDAEVLKRVIDRDLKINLGKTSINKVFKKLITKPPYERCSIGTKENIKKNVNFKEIVYSQQKLDGTYRAAIVTDSDVIIMSRSGKEQVFPYHEEILKTMPKNYVYLGEMTLRGEKQRAKGNGKINSDNPPYEDIIFTLWDMIPIDEYKQKNGTTNYIDRFNLLKKTLQNTQTNGFIELVNTRIVKSLEEVFQHFQELTSAGYEGTIIKTHDMKWKDGTSKQQMKLKIVIEIDVLCVGFEEGTPGTKREKTFGTIRYENHEGTIKGRVSGFIDEELEDFNSRREELIGKVFTIECNDITKAKNKDTYALSHPRFIEFRTKTETDTLERALELKRVAISI